jgi:hypothetical protein
MPNRVCVGPLCPMKHTALAAAFLRGRSFGSRHRTARSLAAGEGVTTAEGCGPRWRLRIAARRR